MIAVTGMHRSGTSCVTGLLNRCGFSLGTSHPLLNNPRPDNQKGHHENLGVLAINDTILHRAGGTWFKIPSVEALEDAAQTLMPHFQSFNDGFDGSVVKDPRLSLTISSWQTHCPRLKTVVFCVRNPIGVALSLQRRDGLSIETGLDLWLQYNIRFLRNVGDLKVIYVNYDLFSQDLPRYFSEILASLGKSFDSTTVREKIDGFYERSLNHDNAGLELLDKLPAQIINVYNLLINKAQNHLNFPYPSN